MCPKYRALALEQLFSCSSIKRKAVIWDSDCSTVVERMNCDQEVVGFKICQLPGLSTLFFLSYSDLRKAS